MGNNLRVSRHASCVDQEKITGSTLGIIGDNTLSDFLLLFARGIGFGGVEHVGEDSKGFLHHLDDIMLLAERMNFEQSYERVSQLSTSDYEINTLEHEVVSPREAGALAGVLGKSIIDKIHGVETGGRILPERGVSQPYKALIVGAGATGTYVGLQAALAGFSHVDIMDADTIDATNLNRQVLYYEAIGQLKAEVLARRLRKFGLSAEGITEYFTDPEQGRGYDVIFSCVDLIAPRRILDEAARLHDCLLVDGGTGAYSGRVMSSWRGKRLGEQINLQREDPVTKPGCAEKHNPSIIMPNMIVGAYMVDEALAILGGQPPRTIHYDAHMNEVSVYG